MGYDKFMRWTPDDDINWESNETAIQGLEAAGLDWSDGGIHTFSTSTGLPDKKTTHAKGAWKNLSEDQRLEVLREYDNWWDGLSPEAQIELGNQDSWGMDLYRGVSYDADEAWDAKKMFHDLVGLKTDNSPGNQIDYNAYNDSHLWRGITDDIMEHPDHQWEGKSLFEFRRDPYTNAGQIRAGSGVMREWSVEKDDYQAHLDTQVTEGALPWNRPFGKNHERNQAHQIARWKPWYTFDPETGTGYEKDINSGEILETIKFQPPPLPQRVQLTSDQSLADEEKGVFYTGLEDGNEKILAGLQPDPGMPKPPSGLNLKIKRYIPRDRSRDYMKIENHPYLGEPEPPNSAANKVEVV